MATDLELKMRLDTTAVEKAAAGLGKTFDKIEKRVGKLGTGKSIKPLGEGLSAATVNANEFEKSMAAANARVIAFGASAGLIFQFQRALRETVKATIEVEKSLTDINVVLGASQSSLQKFGDQLFKVAAQTGQSFQVVATGATELARQGLGTQETLRRVNDALILTRLTGMGAEDAVSALTAAVNSFNKVGITSSEVINKMAKVDQAFAVSSEDLAKSIARVGSSAVDAGVSLDELFAITTAVQQRTARGGAVIGNAFKTIFTRIQRTDVRKKLEGIGVATQDMQGNLLSATTVLQNLAARFQNLSQAQQANIAESVAGVFQVNVLRAALGDLSQQYGIYNSALKASTSASDEAYRKNEQLNQTLSAQLNATVQNLTKVAAVLGEDMFGPAIRTIATGVNDLIQFIEDSPIAKTLGGVFTKGIGAFLSGPGLALAGVAIGKLVMNFVKFGKEAAQSFFSINKIASQFDQTTNLITEELMRQPHLLKQVASGEMSVDTAAKKVNTQLDKQTQELIKQRGLATEIALAMSGTFAGKSGKVTKRRHGGAIPSFSPLGDAVARERKAGVPNYAIRVGSHPALRSGGNPGGLGVYNTIDEPRGISQGVQRYRSQGLNPKTAGMGIPNFVKKDDPLNNALALLLGSPEGEKLRNKLITERAQKQLSIKGPLGSTFTGVGKESFSFGSGGSPIKAQRQQTQIENNNKNFSKSTAAQMKSATALTAAANSLKSSAAGLAKSPFGIGAAALPAMMVAQSMGGGGLASTAMSEIFETAIVASLLGGAGNKPGDLGKIGKAFGKGRPGPTQRSGGAPLNMSLVKNKLPLQGPTQPFVARTGLQRVGSGLAAAGRGFIGMDPSGKGGFSAGRAAKSIGGKAVVFASIGMAINDFVNAFEASELEKEAARLAEMAENDFRPALENASAAVNQLAGGFATMQPRAKQAAIGSIYDQIFGEDIKGKASAEQFEILEQNYNDFVASFSSGSDAVAAAGNKLTKSMALLKEELGKVDDETRKFNARVFYGERTAETDDLNRMKDVALIDTIFNMLAGTKSTPGMEVNQAAYDKFFGSFSKRLPGTMQSFESLQKAGDISKGGFGGSAGSLAVAQNALDAVQTFRGGGFFSRDNLEKALRTLGIDDDELKQQLDLFGNTRGPAKEKLRTDIADLLESRINRASDQIKASIPAQPRGGGDPRMGSMGLFASDEAARKMMSEIDTSIGVERSLMKRKEEEISIQNKINNLKATLSLGIYGDIELRRNQAIEKQTRLLESENKIFDQRKTKAAKTRELAESAASKALIKGKTVAGATELFNRLDPNTELGERFGTAMAGTQEQRAAMIDALQNELLADTGTLLEGTKDLNKFMIAVLQARQEESRVVNEINRDQTEFGKTVNSTKNVIRERAKSEKAVIDANYEIKRQVELDIRERKARMARARAEFTLDDFSMNRMTGDQLRSDAAAARTAGRLDGGLEAVPFAGLGQLTREAFAFNTLDATNEFERGITDVALTIRDSMKDAIKNIASGAESFEDGMFRIFAALADKIADQGISMGVNSIFSVFGAKRHGGKVARGYNKGGVVMGGSGVRDDVPAMMQGGEYVIKKSSAQKIGYGALNAINSYANGGKARVSLAKEFLFTGDDPKRPTGGNFNVSRNLSTAAIFRDDDPQTDRMFGRQDKLVSYLEYRRAEQARRDKVLDDIKRQKRGRLMNAYMSAGLRIGAGFIGQNFGPTAMANRGVTRGTDAAISGDVPIGSPLGVGVDNSATVARGGSPALLMGGEYVMSSRTVNKYGTGFMAQLNSGRMPGYNQGGLVGGGGAAAGVTTNNVNLAINIDKTGNAQVETQEQDSNTNGQGSESQEVENSKKFADAIRAAVQKEITKQQRPGGLLRDGATYAGGRRI